jgi:two-component system, NtrC family, sensor kinase
MRTRIGTLLIVGAGLVTASVIGILVTLTLRAHRAALVAELHRSADQLSETIKSATLRDMLENRRDTLQLQIDTIGRQEGIQNVRVYNKEGRVVFSSDASEVGRSVDKRAEACYACHAENRALERLPIKARARTFDAGGQPVLGIINPIHNRPACWNAGCHAHSAADKVLGVLDLTMSLAEVDRGIARSQRQMVLFAALAILALSLILWWLNRRLVIQPVAALTAATRRVAAGDLTTRIPVEARHELGALARSFNEMIARLAEDQRQLTQADKLASVGRLAAGVAHEINNPLTGVLTYASFLLKRAQDRPELRDDLEVIVRETKRCREIVKGLLDFSRQTPVKRQPTDVNEVVQHAATIVTNQLALNRVTLTVDLAEGLPRVLGDGNQLEQIVVNLLVNAADAIEGGAGRIKVETRLVEPRSDQPWVSIEISDSGHGIPSENLPHLFEPFFSTKGTRGTGLGLAVTWGIVAGHGGTIRAENAPEGGSRFTVHLPASRVEKAPGGGE